MSAETDLLIDRLRLKRALGFWRAAAILALVVALLAASVGQRRLGGGLSGALGRHVARVSITGLITENRKRIEAIEALAKDANVVAVILSIDSPGGSVAGGESLHEAFADIARAKPLVAVMGGEAASAGYMIALPAERIFARDATLTGSIGVLLQTADFGGLLGKVGIDATAITSGPLKDQPSVVRPLTDQGRAYLQGLVGDMFDQFVSMVSEARKLPKDDVLKLADGRAYTGRQALGLKLIDAIGGEAEARAWLAREKGIAADLPISETRERRWNFTLDESESVLGTLRMGLAGILGATDGAPADGGAWAIWRP